MQVKLLHTVNHNGEVFKPGTVIEVDGQLLDQLVKANAVEVEKDKSSGQIKIVEDNSKTKPIKLNATGKATYPAGMSATPQPGHASNVALKGTTSSTSTTGASGVTANPTGVGSGAGTGTQTQSTASTDDGLGGATSK